MSEVKVSTQTDVIRTELAACFRGYPRLIHAFENLLRDVGQALPDAISSTADELQEAVDLAQSAARGALAQGRAALTLAQQASEGPPSRPMIAPAAEDPWAQIHSLRARVARLERQLANLQEGPTL